MTIVRSKLPFLFVFIFAACNTTQQNVYQDKFPKPCTNKWFTAIEQEALLVDQQTGRPPAGSPQWLAALDEKYSIATNTSTKIGDIEWCHQVHQLLIGL